MTSSSSICYAQSSFSAFLSNFFSCSPRYSQQSFVYFLICHRTHGPFLISDWIAYGICICFSFSTCFLLFRLSLLPLFFSFFPCQALAITDLLQLVSAKAKKHAFTLAIYSYARDALFSQNMLQPFSHLVISNPFQVGDGESNGQY